MFYGGMLLPLNIDSLDEHLRTGKLNTAKQEDSHCYS